jgi:hypothetical protein
MRRRILMAGVVLAACTTPTDACGCLLRPPWGILAGRVTRADGTPAAGASLALQARYHDCAAPAYPVTSSPGGVVLPAGAFRLEIDGAPACVRLVARAEGSADSVVADGVLLGPWEDGRPDSVYVTLRLP